MVQFSGSTIQAIGPDPFKPISFRSWLWDAIPGAFPAPVMDIVNHGVMRDSMLWVHGGSNSLEKETETRHDRNPAWDRILSLDSVSKTAIRFGADTADAALLFTQPNKREQPIKWYYSADPEAPPKVASLTVAHDTGDLHFTGGARLTGSVIAKGLSADQKPSRNLRGKNLSVKAGQTIVDVVFLVEEADEDYAVFVEQNWIGNHAIRKKMAKGFTIQFEKAAPKNAKLDWMIVR